MSLFGLFRRKPPIRELTALADFIDRNAAFLMQKGLYEYSRARAGHYAKVLFAEPEFQATVETARWQAYPLGLALVAEMVEGVLRPLSERSPAAMQAALYELVLAVFDRYAAPATIAPPDWEAARAELAGRLAHIGLHAPKRVIDIPEPFADAYFACMPIHEKLRGRDFPTIRNYLKVSLCNIHDELTKRMDARALAATLAQTAGPVA